MVFWILLLLSLLVGAAAMAAIVAYRLLLWMPGRSFAGAPPDADAEEAELAEELRRDVEHLATTIGERNISRRPAALEAAANWIEKELARVGYAAERQVYEADGFCVANLAVERPGNVRPGRIFVVGAHYDSERGTPGANDNASAVAANLALARRLAHGCIDTTVRFLFFVNEEQPYAHTPLMGSHVYASRCRDDGEDIRGMICLETLGCFVRAPGSQRYPPPLQYLYPDRADFVAIVGNIASGGFTRRVVRAFRRAARLPSLGLVAPERLRAIARSDHWSFWRHGFPAVMITDTADFRSRDYHQPTDTPEKIDYLALARIVLALERTLPALDD